MTKEEKIYTFLCVFFSVLIVVGNLTYQKFVKLSFFSLYTLELSVGILMYPLTFLVTDLICEFYGREKAKFCVKSMVVISTLVALLIKMMQLFEATSWSRVSDEVFDQVFGVYDVGFFGSLLASYLAQQLDVRLYLFFKRLSPFLFVRNAGSTLCSLLLDTILVISTLTLLGALPKEQFSILIANSYLFKAAFTIAEIPLFYAGVFLIRKIAFRSQSLQAIAG